MQEQEVRIYRYLFSDGSSLEVEAGNRVQARQIINKHVYGNREQYKGVTLEGEYVTKPLQDVTRKEVNGKVYIWIGFETSNTGWIEYELYKKLRKEIRITGRKIK